MQVVEGWLGGDAAMNRSDQSRADESVGATRCAGGIEMVVGGEEMVRDRNIVPIPIVY